MSRPRVLRSALVTPPGVREAAGRSALGVARAALEETKRLLEEQGVDVSEFRPDAEDLLTRLAGMGRLRIDELRAELAATVLPHEVVELVQDRTYTF